MGISQWNHESYSSLLLGTIDTFLGFLMKEGDLIKSYITTPALSESATHTNVHVMLSAGLQAAGNRLLMIHKRKPTYRFSVCYRNAPPPNCLSLLATQGARCDSVLANGEFPSPGRLAENEIIISKTSLGSACQEEQETA